jgi:hypothetical protein
VRHCVILLGGFAVVVDAEDRISLSAQYLIDLLYIHIVTYATLDQSNHTP